ncbi:uncharacterized protein TrAtP1_006652 [Trichoderma atroviride]|uniref:uncharacterized protein n=1 Tax=Hypocrea atroviridis TaxID=63577 RepID=UPI0033333049|nr:hypothetical protein TrAtP1_006652 [Trichoderma atroviride]
MAEVKRGQKWRQRTPKTANEMTAFTQIWNHELEAHLIHHNTLSLELSVLVTHLTQRLRNQPPPWLPQPSPLFSVQSPLFSLAALLRLILLFYGIWQDAHSAVKYTDIDYLVFTDAARYVSQGLSPYHRETYRYTPLLAWMLVPTATPQLFSFGKVVFALADLLAGWLIIRVLTKQRGMSVERADTITRFLSPQRIQLTLISLLTFMGLNVLMYYIYGTPFLVHSYFHHVTRIDHRHNFSPYNIFLYLASADPSSSSLHAFLPQLLLSCFLIPFVLAKKDLATSMMAQTFAFVTFNKVCTSQYFLWYIIFLPLYLPGSSMLRVPSRGIAALLLWVLGQAAWLQQGYELEFLGVSTFFPGMWLASLGFFLINCWILGIIISDGAEVRLQKVHTA